MKIINRIKCLFGKHKSRYVPYETLWTGQTIGYYLCEYCHAYIAKERSDMLNQALKQQASTLEEMRAAIRQKAIVEGTYDEKIHASLNSRAPY